MLNKLYIPRGKVGFCLVVNSQCLMMVVVEVVVVVMEVAQKLFLKAVEDGWLCGLLTY